MGLELKDDPRWRRLHENTWVCPCCSERHCGVFDLACDRPDHWPGDEEFEDNSQVGSKPNVLTEDFCVLEGEHFFVRAFLELPIIGADQETFGIGVWTTLAKANFDRYLETFDVGDQGHLGPWFGWFSNRLRSFPDTLNLECQVQPQDGRQRPFLHIEQSDHPLAVAQRDGITFDQLLDIYAAYDHDIRETLT